MLDAVLFKNMKGAAEKLVQAARGGEHWAIALMLKNQMPLRTTAFELPPIDNAADLPLASKAILEAMAAGELSATEGAAILAGLESHGRISTLAGHEDRLAAVEALLGANGKSNGDT
jgi:hypothetical protein